MIRLKVIIVILAIFTAGTAITGCYTMLRHPQVKAYNESSGSEMTEGIGHGERCTDCHTGNVHGATRGVGRGYGWSDYDPFWGYNGYYDPWLYNSWYGSPYFYDNYYHYQTMPWWLYDTRGSDTSESAEPGEREKPLRRGTGSDSRRGSTPSEPGIPGGGIQKPAPSVPPASGENNSPDNSEKEKPNRRGIK